VTAPARLAGVRAGTFNEGNRTRAGALSSNDLAAPAGSASRGASPRRPIPGARGGAFLAVATGRTGRGLGRGIIDGAPIAALVLALAVLTGCASLAPGEDPVVVRTEQALSVGDAIYKDGMAWWFIPGVAEGMRSEVNLVFDAVRTGFDPVYKDVQSALDTYKAVKRAVVAGQSGDQAAALAAVNNAVAKLGALVNQILAQIPKANQKLSQGRLVGGA